MSIYDAIEWRLIEQDVRAQNLVLIFPSTASSLSTLSTSSSPSKLASFLNEQSKESVLELKNCPRSRSEAF